ncbi:MAG: hypothetical protein JKY41_15800 [Rhodobacteraceae bacterium]|nr:hypothetical protein [Paracoccaceae bacterium]
MNKLTSTAIALVLGAASLASSVSAEIIGVYLRNGEEFILIRTTDEGLMFCTRVGDGFEMCNGASEQDDGSWAGNGMKNPDMPSFMTFSGKVVFSETEVSIEGCVAGNSQCEAEVWPKQ